MGMILSRAAGMITEGPLTVRGAAIIIRRTAKPEIEVDPLIGGQREVITTREIPKRAELTMLGKVAASVLEKGTQQTLANTNAGGN